MDDEKLITMLQSAGLQLHKIIFKRSPWEWIAQIATEVKIGAITESVITTGKGSTLTKAVFDAVEKMDQETRLEAKKSTIIAEDIEMKTLQFRDLVRNAPVNNS